MGTGRVNVRLSVIGALLLVAGLFYPAQAPAQENNDFYDNEPFINLPLDTLEVGGEVARPGRVDLSVLTLRSVMVREARLRDGKDAFVGAYVYQGYSLFDILRERIVAKKNEKEFGSVIDLFVIVENAKGEKAVFSWGEIFYPTALHRVLIAAKAARIVPSLTKERWPLPEKGRIVAADDLIAERNIESPVRITVVSGPLHFTVKKGKSPLYAASCRILDHGKKIRTLNGFPVEAPRLSLPTVFYGRGKGIHGITRFEGIPLDFVLGTDFPLSKEALREGYFIAAGEDGYRIVLTYSEIFNRSDNGRFLVTDRGDKEGGRFSLFPSPDFFSDRAVKALKEIHYLTAD